MLEATLPIVFFRSQNIEVVHIEEHAPNSQEPTLRWLKQDIGTLLFLIIDTISLNSIEEVRTRYTHEQLTDDYFIMLEEFYIKRFNNDEYRKHIDLRMNTLLTYINLCNSYPEYCNTVYLGRAFLSLPPCTVETGILKTTQDGISSFFDHLPFLIDDYEMLYEDFQRLEQGLKSNKIAYMATYRCKNLLDICSSSLYEIISSGNIIKKCESCGRFFVPYNRSDSIYCDRISPFDNTKTCKKYGAEKQYQENLKNSESMKLYRNIYMAKQMLVKRHPEKDDPVLYEVYMKSFETYKAQSKQWKMNVKAGIKTESEFITWLKSVKEKRVL